MFEKEAEEYATRECCRTCNNVNHFCKEKCECWTFAKKGAEFGYSKANEQLLKAKELLTKWVELFKPKGGNIPPTPIQVETEQFISAEMQEKEPDAGWEAMNGDGE
jgi:hypothetical protein